MDIIQVIKGEKEIAQEQIRAVCKDITREVRKGLGAVRMKDSMKKVMFPIMKGLGIPFIDAGLNGVIVGDDMDKVDDHVRLI